tara:strand:+ start:2932 stop:3213 length:282 start_codon:yes stop_codon:yes gene_type:complete
MDKLASEVYEIIFENENLYIEDILKLKLVSKEFYYILNNKKYYLTIINSLQDYLKQLKHSKNMYKSRLIRTQLIAYESSYSSDSEFEDEYLLI